MFNTFDDWGRLPFCAGPLSIGIASAADPPRLHDLECLVSNITYPGPNRLRLIENIAKLASVSISNVGYLSSVCHVEKVYFHKIGLGAHIRHAWALRAWP